MTLSPLPSIPGWEKAAASDAAVLLLGAAGTGRSALARLLHSHSRRAAKPLVEFDAGEAAPSLFESELFGHRAGAFTGAVGRHPGRLERADKGSLVLDRVEELPLPIQPKLLRALAEGRFTPLGGRERSADVRVLSTGPEDLAERVERGLFRRDLFHRLEVLRLRLPPLAERRDEIPSIAAAFLGDLAARFALAVPALSPATHEWMSTHTWPGNLRELRNLLERALINAPPETFTLDIPPPSNVRRAEARPQPLATLEANAIRQALAYARGRQGEAARLLGISRKSLWERRKRFGIP